MPEPVEAATVAWRGPDLPTAIFGGPKPTHPEPSLRAALQSITSAIVFHAGDWGLYPREAWIYGIAVGWECEDQHEHDDICGGSDPLIDVAAQHGWDEAAVERLRGLRRHYRAAERPTQSTPSASPCPGCEGGWGFADNAHTRDNRCQYDTQPKASEVQEAAQPTAEHPTR